MTKRAYLIGLLEAFLDGLAGHGASPRYAPDVKVTENNRTISPGEGLWREATKIGPYQILAADEETSQAGFVGQIWRGEDVSICGIRIACHDDRISAVEIIRGPDRFPGAKGVDARTLTQARPCYGMIVPDHARMARADLMATAAGYYAAVNEGKPDLAALDPAGVRIEAGTQITGNPDFAFEFYAAQDGADLPNFGLWSARDQFQRGLWNADGVTDLRIDLVDRTAGIVFAFATYRPWHKRGWVDVEGVGRVGPIGDPERRVALNMLEAFKIEDGSIKEMESVWSIEPADYRSVWAGGEGMG